MSICQFSRFHKQENLKEKKKYGKHKELSRRAVRKGFYQRLIITKMNKNKKQKKQDVHACKSDFLHTFHSPDAFFSI